TPRSPASLVSELSVLSRDLTVARARPRRPSSTAKSRTRRRPDSRLASSSATASARFLPRKRANSSRLVAYACRVRPDQRARNRSTSSSAPTPTVLPATSEPTIQAIPLVSSEQLREVTEIVLWPWRCDDEHHSGPRSPVHERVGNAWTSGKKVPGMSALRGPNPVERRFRSGGAGAEAGLIVPADPLRPTSDRVARRLPVPRTRQRFSIYVADAVRESVRDATSHCGGGLSVMVRSD